MNAARPARHRPHRPRPPGAGMRCCGATAVAVCRERSL